MRLVRTSLLAVLAAYPLLVGYGGANSFQVAPLRPTDGNYVPGTWVDSDTVSSKDAVTVVVMASWCPHCARMIDQLATDPSARSKVDMILFFDDENGRNNGGRAFITYPSKLAGRDLPYYFAKKNQFEGLYSGYPTVLSCSKDGCTRKSRSDLGLK